MMFPLYDNFRASLLFWCNMTIMLVNDGYIINTYNLFVANRMLEVWQLTIIRHVDNLKLCHVSYEVLTHDINIIDKVIGILNVPLIISEARFTMI